jgi:hypothetical protein
MIERWGECLKPWSDHSKNVAVNWNLLRKELRGVQNQKYDWGIALFFFFCPFKFYRTPRMTVKELAAYLSLTGEERRKIYLDAPFELEAEAKSVKA